MKEFISGFKNGVKKFSHNIALIVNTFLLTIVYLTGVGLTSIIAKLIGKNFLDIRISKKRPTYWTDLNLKKKPIERYFRQF